MDSHIDLQMKPRESIGWDKFLAETPKASIALDGYVLGGPNWDERTLHVNFDHHDNVIREATMSTCMQVYYAIKGGFMKRFLAGSEDGKVHVFMNDTDQDSTLAYLLLNNHKLFEGTASNPAVNRMLELINRADITGGGFPMNIRAKVVRQRNWLFQPYTSLRKSGKLAVADAGMLRDNIGSMEERFAKFLMGEAGEVEPDLRHEILYQSPHGWWLVNEIGGTDAREYLFSTGMDAFIAIVATRPDGRRVSTVGRRTRYVDYPVPELYPVYNKLEGLTLETGWNGSDIVGGSSRSLGTALTNEQLISSTDSHLAQRKSA
ncbi:MAG: hypothetical protein Q8Q31_00540 [Nanoarchaeota archaeon]|nr:hypothetical protein [Nanoarchaeota archaeon]